MTETHDAVEFMERMVDEIGLTRDTPPAVQDEMLSELHAEAGRRFRDPDLLDAAFSTSTTGRSTGRNGLCQHSPILSRM